MTIKFFDKRKMSHYDDEPKKVIILDRGYYTTCTVHLLGATITSWRIHNKEQLFLSRQAVFNQKRSIRGGISFVFPYVGRWSLGPAHGFVRIYEWIMVEPPTKLENGDVYAVFSMSNCEYSESTWNFQFTIKYKIVLKEKELFVEMFIDNTSKNFPFDFTILRHTYFKVPDVTKCKIEGLQNAEYSNIGTQDVGIEDQEFLTINGFIDRLYKKVARNELMIHNVANGGKMKITSKNLPDIIVWNPWEEKKLLNFDQDEYQYMINVEGGVVAKPVRLQPLEQYYAIQNFEKIDPPDEYDVHGLEDIFAKVC